MRLVLLPVAGVLTAIAGCASVPDIADREYVKVSDILYSVECELKEAIDSLARTYPFVRKQLVEVKYSLDVIETGSGAGDANLVVPISHGTFSVGFTAGLLQTTTRATSFSVSYKTDELECRPPGSAPDVPTRIAGGVGLSEWLLSISAALRAANETPVAMSYRMDFDIVADASVTPRFGVSLASGHSYGGGVRLAGRRQRSHSVLVAVAKVDADDKGAVEAQKRIDREIDQSILKEISR
jgi:hypothetical protein